MNEPLIGENLSFAGLLSMSDVGRHEGKEG